MGRETYVRPPLVPREAPAAWRAVWPFRLVVLLLLGAAVAGLLWAYATFNDAAQQDPGLSALPAASRAR